MFPRVPRPSGIFDHFGRPDPHNLKKLNESVAVEEKPNELSDDELDDDDVDDYQESDSEQKNDDLPDSVEDLKKIISKQKKEIEELRSRQEIHTSSVNGILRMMEYYTGVERAKAMQLFYEKQNLYARVAELENQLEQKKYIG
jgi:predicted RNase H-like nuclease (RuvC/YqgF family)